MKCSVVVIADAEEQLKQIAAWWREHRALASPAFLAEFEKAVETLSEFPEIGPRFIRARRPGIRRLLLKRSEHWVYYFHDRRRALVYVLALWSVRRGSDPKLPRHLGSGGP